MCIRDRTMIYDEVALGLQRSGLTEEQIREKVEATLRVCGLYPFRNWPISALSFGPVSYTHLDVYKRQAQACLEILKHYNVPLSGKRAVVVGRSLVVGKPAAMMLDRENATVTLCNSRTRDLPALCREADVLVVAMGRRGAIGADCLREGQVAVSYTHLVAERQAFHPADG